MERQARDGGFGNTALRCAGVAAAVAAGYGLSILAGRALETRGAGRLLYEHLSFVLFPASLLLLNRLFFHGTSRDFFLSREKEGWNWERVLLYGILSGLLIGGLAALYRTTVLRRAVALRPDPAILLGNILSDFCKEFAFRGFALGLLKKYAGERKALFFSSLLFTLFHEGYGLLSRLLLCISGLFIGWLVLRSRRLATAWVCHVSLDAVLETLFPR